MEASDQCIALIKRFEGLRLTPYDDVAGKKTIGYGHLIRDGETFDAITEDQADNLLREDVKTVEKCVNSLVRITVAQYEFDALVCFTFNLGCRALQSSTLLRRVNLGDFDAAADEFLRWKFAAGREVSGLLNRRIVERDLFLGKLA